MLIDRGGFGFLPKSKPNRNFGSVRFIFFRFGFGSFFFPFLLPSKKNEK